MLSSARDDVAPPRNNVAPPRNNVALPCVAVAGSVRTCVRRVAQGDISGCPRVAP
jgi:hypothetical protein